MIFDLLCLLLNRKHHRFGRITLRNAEPHLHSATSFQPKSSEEKMVIGKVGHLINYGANLRSNMLQTIGRPYRTEIRRISSLRREN